MWFRRINSAAGNGQRRLWTKAKRIILIRHGESAGNVDPAAYVRTPDWQIALTEKGIAQARSTGHKLAALVKDEPVYFCVSPYRRTRQTLEELGRAINKASVLGVREDPRLAEQQFGNFQDVEAVKRAKADRHRFGRFFYRFPNGEAGMDVYNRASSFFGSLIRDTRPLA